MAVMQSLGLAEMVEQALDQVGTELADGLSGEQAAWAKEAYRVTILPALLRNAIGADERIQARFVENAAEDVRSTLGGRDAPARWQAIRTAYYAARLEPIGDAAFRRALARDSGSAPVADITRSAETVCADLHALIAEMEEQASAAKSDLRETISESLLDCKYAREAGPLVSLRLSHASKPRTAPDPVLPAADTCPKCGRDLKPGAKFCAGCGASTGADAVSAEITCPSAQCGRKVAAGKRFCPACGEKMP